MSSDSNFIECNYLDLKALDNNLTNPCDHFLVATDYQYREEDEAHEEGLLEIGWDHATMQMFQRSSEDYKAIIQENNARMQASLDNMSKAFDKFNNLLVRYLKSSKASKKRDRRSIRNDGVCHALQQHAVIDDVFTSLTKCGMSMKASLTESASIKYFETVADTPSVELSATSL